MCDVCYDVGLLYLLLVVGCFGDDFVGVWCGVGVGWWLVGLFWWFLVLCVGWGWFVGGWCVVVVWMG